MTEGEMVGWHHRLNGHECKQTWGDSGGQRNLECCSPWGCKESDMTERLSLSLSPLSLVHLAFRPPWPGTIVIICMSCFMTGDPDKEYGTNKPPPTRRVQERWKGDTACPSTSQNPSCQHPSWLSDACATRKDSELE